MLPISEMDDDADCLWRRSGAKGIIPKTGIHA